MTRGELADTKRRLGMAWAQIAKETGYSESHLYHCLDGQRKITKRLQVVLELFEKRMETGIRHADGSQLSDEEYDEVLGPQR